MLGYKIGIFLDPNSSFDLCDNDSTTTFFLKTLNFEEKREKNYLKWIDYII